MQKQIDLTLVLSLRNLQEEEKLLKAFIMSCHIGLNQDQTGEQPSKKEVSRILSKMYLAGREDRSKAC